MSSAAKRCHKPGLLAMYAVAPDGAAKTRCDLRTRRNGEDFSAVIVERAHCEHIR